MVGLPPFLRRCFMVVAKAFPPIMSATVKSKCWNNLGQKVCSKEGHSCMRRVFDFSGERLKKGWRIMARAARALVQANPDSLEVWDMARLSTDLDLSLSHLHSSPAASAAMLLYWVSFMPRQRTSIKPLRCVGAPAWPPPGEGSFDELRDLPSLPSWSAARVGASLR